MSWWHSLESVSKVKDALDVIVLIAGLVTAFAATGGWIVGRRVATLQGQKEATTQRVLDKAHERVDALEKLQPLRRLQDKQRELFTNKLLSYAGGPVSMSCPLESKEGCAFANELKELLINAGWVVDGEVERVVSGNFGAGIGLFYNNNKPNKSLEILKEAFAAIDLPVIVRTEPRMFVNRVLLSVGKLI